MTFLSLRFIDGTFLDDSKIIRKTIRSTSSVQFKMWAEELKKNTFYETTFVISKQNRLLISLDSYLHGK